MLSLVWFVQQIVHVQRSTRRLGRQRFIRRRPLFQVDAAIDVAMMVLDLLAVNAVIAGDSMETQKVVRRRSADRRFRDEAIVRLTTGRSAQQNHRGFVIGLERMFILVGFRLFVLGQNFVSGNTHSLTKRSH